MRVLFFAINKISENNKAIIRKTGAVGSILFFIFFFTELWGTSSRIAYMIFGFAALFAFAFDFLLLKTGVDAKTENVRPDCGNRAILIMCTLFGVSVVLANYTMYEELPIILQIIVIMIIICSSSVVFYTILSFFNRTLPNYCINKRSLLLPHSTFLVFALLISVVYLFFFLFSEYPGGICTDSMDQIQQILDGSYSNHHPVYHTFLIQVFFNLGRKVFKDINDAIAVYTIFQIFFMAGVFALTVTTFIDAGASKFFSYFWLIWFMAAPFHITFSFTIWKDSIFGGVVCLFTVSLFRCINRIGNGRINHILLFGSAVCFCIFRSNGLFAFVLFSVIFRFVLGRKEKYYLKIFLIAIAASLILKYPVLQALSIEQPDTVEALSVPLQQIARVANEGGKFTDKEIEFIESIASLERMGEVYKPSVSDDVKDLIRYEGNQDYLAVHKFGFFKTWLSVVIHHPVLTVRAWVDQTSGYWNPGADYWIKWWDGVYEENGFRRIVLSKGISDYFHQYIYTFTDSYYIFGLVYNVGLHVWIILICAALCVYRKNKSIIYLLPSLTLTGTLLIATPMHDEFRYAYYVFTCFPIIIYATMIEGFYGEEL